MPAIFYWPGKIKPATVDGMAANLDLFATFAKLSGGSQPADKPGYISKDLTGTLLAGEPSPRSTWAFHKNAYRSGRYKIHVVTSAPTDPIARRRKPITRHDPPLLFDLEADLGEQANIAAQHPEIVARLLEEQNAFLSGQ